jgi:hypothetical protein
MGICVFLYNQKLQRVDAGEIAPAPPSAPPPSSAPSAPPSAPPPPFAPLDEVEELVKQLAKTKKVAELKRQLAEAQALLVRSPPPPVPTGTHCLGTKKVRHLLVACWLLSNVHVYSFETLVCKI